MPRLLPWGEERPRIGAWQEGLGVWACGSMIPIPPSPTSWVMVDHLTLAQVLKGFRVYQIELRMTWIAIRDDLNLAIRTLPTSDCYLHVEHVIILDFKIVMSLSKLIVLGNPKQMRTPRYFNSLPFLSSTLRTTPRSRRRSPYSFEFPLCSFYWCQLPCKRCIRWSWVCKEEG